MCIATTWPNLRSNENKCNIIAVALVYIIYIDGICTVYTGIRAVYAGIRWYTLVCAGIRVVYARYTRGIREACVVYARYTLGICVVYAWYTLVYAHDPHSPKTVRTASGDDRLR